MAQVCEKNSHITGKRLNGSSVKTKLYNTPPTYFIVLASSVKILEVKAIEFHHIIKLAGACQARPLSFLLIL